MLLDPRQQRIWFAVLALLAASPACAAATDWVGDANAAVRLVTVSDTAGPAGPIQAGLEFRYGAGWHGAWRNPGDAGLAPNLDWSAAEGVGAARLGWPAPTRFAAGDLQTYVYAGHVVLPVTLEREGSGPVHLRAAVRHAVCGEVCVPYRATLDLALPDGPATRAAEADLIEAGRAAVPVSTERAGISVTGAALDGAAERPVLTLVLRSRSLPFLAPDVFVEAPPRGASPPPRVSLTEDGQVAALNVALPPASIPAPGVPMSLVVVDGTRAVRLEIVPTPIGAAPRRVEARSERAFDPARIPDLVAAGRIVLVEVTAAWCLTCKVNDILAFDRAAVRDRLGRTDIVRMRADWTSPNPAIRAYLQGFRRYGVPLVVLYGPGRPAGEALPELLSQSVVLGGLARAAAPDDGSSAKALPSGAAP